MVNHTIRSECEICGQNNWEILLQNQMISVCSGREVIRDAQLIKGMCQHCGFVHTLKSPLDQEIDQYYQNVYSSKLRSESYDYLNYSHGLTFSEVQQKFVLSYDFLPSGKMMDVACGKALFDKIFARKYPNWIIEGVDPSKKSIEFARKNFPEGRFYQKNFEGKDYETDNYDLICMHAVLNRVPPRKFIKEASDMLKIGGIFSAEVVIFPVAPFQLFFADHAYMYFKEHVLALAEEFHLHLIKEDTKGSKWRFLFKKDYLSKTPQKDELHNAEGSIKAAVGSVVAAWEKLFHDLNQCKSQKKSVALYGQGTTLMILLSNIDFPADLIVGIYDDNPHKVGEEAFGVKIVQPDDTMTAADSIFLCAGPEGLSTMMKRLNGFKGQIFHL